MTKEEYIEKITVLLHHINSLDVLERIYWFINKRLAD